MKRAFTLIELLVVIGIMGLMGTVSVGGYRAMQRGMEERGVMENVNAVIKTAYERAQIDRRPTVMYFWNETLRAETADENEIVVGRAVAVRQQGRLSQVAGEVLVDEFADLNLAYATDTETDSEGSEAEQGGDGAGDAGDNTMYLYCLDRLNPGDTKMRSIVSARVTGNRVNEVFLQGRPQDSDSKSSYSGGKMKLWGFKVEDANGVTWKTGSAYGFEFAELTLPHNYIFGSKYSKTLDDPVQGEDSMVFSVGRNDGLNGVQSVGNMGSITVYSLRPDGSGGLKAEKVDTNDSPN